MNAVMVAALGLLTDVLSDGGPQNSGPEFGKASPFGLLVIVLLLLGTFALVWSMNRQLKKVPKSFDTPGPDPDHGGDAGRVATAGGDDAPESTG